MPQSKPSRKKSAGKNPIQAVLEQARAIDRRRQLQIQNQAASIDRLLGVISEHSCLPIDSATGKPTLGEPMRGYAGELEILHGACAQYQFENETALTIIRQLVEAIDGTPLDGVSWGTDKHRRDALAEALAAARALITPVQPGTDGVDPLRAASDVQSSSGDEAG